MDKKTEDKIFEEKIPEKVRTYQETKKAKMKIFSNDNNINYERDKNSSDTWGLYSNKYNPDKTELYKTLESFEEAKEEGKNLVTSKQKYDNKLTRSTIPLFRFNSDKGFENFKIKDKEAKKLKKYNDLNGISERRQFETMKNFTADEVASKTNFVMKLTNSKENIKAVYQMQEDYNLGIYDKIIEKGNLQNTKENDKYVEDAILAKNFFDKYEILNECYVDPKTKMSAWVVGNKENNTIEIFFGGSNNPSGLILQNNTNADWGNDARSVLQTPPNYKVAYQFVNNFEKEYEKEKNGKYKNYSKGIEAVNGFSKGGGEAIYVASRKNLKALVVDPAPVISPGVHIGNNKILAIVPGNGDAMLNRAVNIPGTKLYTLEQKAGISEGKGKHKTSIIPAIPVPAKGKGLFDDHFADVYSVKKRFEETEKYISEIKDEHYAYFNEEKGFENKLENALFKEKKENKKTNDINVIK